MNFKFTTKSTLIFIGALIGAGVISTWADNALIGLAIMVATVYYLANDKPKK